MENKKQRERRNSEVGTVARIASGRLHPSSNVFIINIYNNIPIISLL
jgi:hypothetical protein